MARRIEIQIIGDATSLAKAAKSATGDLGNIGNEADKGSGKWSKFSGAAKAAAVGGIGLVAVALKGSVTAAKDAQVSQSAMEAQLKASNISYKTNASQIDAVIQKHSKLAGVDDEELQGAFTAIVRSTGNVTTAMKDMGLVTDLARAKNMNVAKAGEMLAKVHAGNTGVLKRMGIEFTKTTANVDALKASNEKFTPAQLAAAKAADQTANSQRALGLLQEKVGGQAAAYGKTAAGAQDRFKVAVENLQQSVGEALLPMFARLANALAGLMGWFEKHKTITTVLIGAFAALGVALGAMKVYAMASAAATGVATAAQWLWNAALTANPIGLVVVAIAALVAAFVLAWKNSETFRNIVTGAFNAVKDAATAVFNAVRSVVTGAWNAISAVTTTVWNAIKDSVLGPVRAVRDTIGAIVGAIGTVLSGAWSGIKSAANAAWDFVGDNILAPVRAARDAIGAIASGIGNRVETAWGAVKGIISKAAEGIESALTAPFNAAKSAIEGIIERIKGLISSIKNAPGKLLGKLGIGGSAQGGTISGLATGGMVMRRVGELGPEDVLLPVGAQVTQASQSGGGGGMVVNFNGPVGSQKAARVAANSLAFRLRYG